MRAIRVSAGEAAELTEAPEPEPADGEVLVDVLFSSLNFKDALALAGSPGVVRTSPLTPGIDVVGRVRETRHADWRSGDLVVLTGAGLGETRDGGYADAAVLPGHLLTRVPEGFGGDAAAAARRAAALGTAGFTAAQAVLALERRGLPEGPVAVTAASGGVGSIGIALLAAAGREVVAVTGRPDEAERFTRLGASGVLDRAELADPGRPLQKARWAGALDGVGGATLANLLAQTRYGGAVAAYGLVGSDALETSVHPFILRGVALLGINSVEAPAAARAEVWARLARDLDLRMLDDSTREIALDEVVAAGEHARSGNAVGRTVVRVGG